jgi:hypothetical protein
MRILLTSRGGKLILSSADLVIKHHLPCSKKSTSTIMIALRMYFSAQVEAS